MKLDWQKKTVRHAMLALSLALTLSTGFSSEINAQTSEPTDRIDVAQFNADGELLRPADLEQWVFMGSSLGMGYNEAEFNADNPGMFQITTLEPTAYEYFLKHKKFAEGSLFALNFYSAKQRLANNRSGFVIGDLLGSELHMLDSERFADGHNFFSFQPGSQSAKVLPDGNACVSCHDENGAFQSTFAQFYPTIRHLLPAGVLDAALEVGTERLK